MNTLITIADAEDFFKRGKLLAQLADQGQSIPNEKIISFEDPEDLAQLMTASKINLFREIKRCPGSINELAIRLQRKQTAVKRDIDMLERMGLVKIEEKISAKYRPIQEVRVIAEQILVAM